MTDATPPRKDADPIRVTAAVLRRDGLVLLCRRTRPAYLLGKWEFPGGKIEPGESPQVCLARELREELGIEARVGRHVASHVHHYEALSLELIAHEVSWMGGDLHMAQEHDAHEWVPPGELLDWDLAPADVPIARAIVQGHRPGGGVDFATSPMASPASTASSSNAQAQIELHKELAPRYAYRYSFEFSRLFQQDWHSEMISHVPAGAKELLDIGCGTGFFLAELEQEHAGSVGFDISHEMLQVSEQYIPGAKLVCGDAEHMPFAHGRFDVVFCKGSLHHMRDHIAFLTGCRETLREGGVLIMSEPCNDNPIIRLARAVMYRRSKHFDTGDQGFTRRGIIDLTEQAGFEVLKVKKYGVLAYVFAGFPDHLGLLRFVPGSAWVTRFFLGLDRVICALPGLSLLGFHVVVVARPRGSKA